MKTPNVRIVSILLGTALCVSCASAPVVPRMQRAIGSAVQTPHSGQLTLEQEQWLGELCPFGTPEAELAVDHGFTELVVRPGYALQHSGELKIPLWVCERMDVSKLDGPFERKDDFRADDALEGPASQLGDYKGSGYARGHHAPAEDFSHDKQQMSDSFFLSNMSPQVTAVNSGAWAQLEKRVRRWVAEDAVTWIITGALLYDPEEDDPATADGWVEYLSIGTGVAVPTHLFKIVVGQDAAGGTTATAYVVPNAKLPRGYKIDDYRRPIRWIEARSGFNFMPALEPGESEDLEASVGPARSP